MEEENKPADVFHPVFRALNEEEKELVNKVKEKALELYNLFSLIKHPFEVREGALAKTKLEESVMWAVKGITR